MIFISYRREEIESVVVRIHSELKMQFPTPDVFLDHDRIPLRKPLLDVSREHEMGTGIAPKTSVLPQMRSSIAGVRNGP